MADSTFRLKPKSGPGLVVKDDASIDILRGSSGTQSLRQHQAWQIPPLD